MDHHEVKDNPPADDHRDYRILEAYGDRKCPKLVEQVASEIHEIRIRALEVLCDEFKNPFSIFGCVEAGAIGVLSEMCTDPDSTTRLLASRAVALASRDTYGAESILQDEAVPTILKAMHDLSSEVRGCIYDCLYHLTSTAKGVEICVNHGASLAVAKVISTENESLQPLLLRCICNMSSVRIGLDDALNADSVQVCISLLSSDNLLVRAEACRTVGVLCFSDRGKDIAVENSLVSELMRLLVADNAADTTKNAKKSSSSPAASNISLNASLALMAVTTTDEGKRQLSLIASTVDVLLSLLRAPNRVVSLNALKIVSNAAVHPTLRASLNRQPDVIDSLKEMAASEDSLTAKHANLALKAVMWRP